MRRMRRNEPRTSHFLKQEAIAHLLRAASAITNEPSFDLFGTGAVIARAKTLPLDLSRTRELDLQLPDDERGRVIADPIDGSIGEGSQFDATFGYYAHAIAEGTAQLPARWRSRAMKIEVQAGLSCICPDASDIALSKIAAWREGCRLAPRRDANHLGRRSDARPPRGDARKPRLYGTATAARRRQRIRATCPATNRRVVEANTIAQRQLGTVTAIRAPVSECARNGHSDVAFLRSPIEP